MQNPSAWETILIGLVALLAIFWYGRGLRATIERSKQVESDWPAVLIPLALVIVFVFLLILAS
jgi:hypothetical protein